MKKERFIEMCLEGKPECFSTIGALFDKLRTEPMSKLMEAGLIYDYLEKCGIGVHEEAGCKAEKETKEVRAKIKAEPQ